ncbi:MAG: hypothetical protein J6X89_02550 [Bacteroidales bacterium]|nr:hypothetical protein [Bacteroidales bacterium]
MKKLTLLIAAAFISAMALTSCIPSTESSGWLKGTTWEADLVGKQVSYGYMDGEHTINGGLMKIHFSSQGYKLIYEFSADLGITSQGQITSRSFPEYSFPELNIPFTIGDDKDDQETVYSTGIFSDDLDEIYFDELNTGNMVIKDVTFIR